MAEIHVDGGAVEHVLRIAVADDGAIGPGAQAGHGHVGVAARGRDRVPDRLEDLQRVRRHFVVAVQPDDQLAARLAHAAVERRFLVLVVLPDIADGKSRARLPCQHRGVRVVRGAIIHHDPFEVLEGLLTERLVHPVQRARPVVGWGQNGKNGGVSAMPAMPLCDRLGTAAVLILVSSLVFSPEV